MIDEPTLDDMEAANPSSVFAAQNGDVEKAIEVNNKKAEDFPEDSWEKEILEAAALLLEDEL